VGVRLLHLPPRRPAHQRQMAQRESTGVPSEPPASSPSIPMWGGNAPADGSAPADASAGAPAPAAPDARAPGRRAPATGRDPRPDRAASRAAPGRAGALTLTVRARSVPARTGDARAAYASTAAPGRRRRRGAGRRGADRRDARREAPAGPMSGPVREARLARPATLAAALTHEVTTRSTRSSPPPSCSTAAPTTRPRCASTRVGSSPPPRGARRGVTRLGRFVRQEPPADGHVVPFDLPRSPRACSPSAVTAGARVASRSTPPSRPGRPPAGLPDDARAALLRVVDNAIEAMPTGGRLAVTRASPPSGRRRARGGRQRKRRERHGGAATAGSRCGTRGPGWTRSCAIARSSRT
jgi:hypothetical protein